MFWKDADESSEKFAENVNSLVENMGNRRNSFRFLIFFGVANLIIWLCVILFSEAVTEAFLLVHNVSDKNSFVVLSIPLWLGMFATYAVFRLKFPDIEDQKTDSDVMSSYNFQIHSTKRWYIWCLSVFAGIINVLLLILADIYLTNGF